MRLLVQSCLSAFGSFFFRCKKDNLRYCSVDIFKGLGRLFNHVFFIFGRYLLPAFYFIGNFGLRCKQGGIAVSQFPFALPKTFRKIHVEQTGSEVCFIFPADFQQFIECLTTGKQHIHVVKLLFDREFCNL